MQADVRSALGTLRQLDVSLLSDGDKIWRDRMRERFEVASWVPEESATLGDTVVGSYRRYWRRSLTSPADRHEYLADLVDELAPLVPSGADRSVAVDIDGLEERLAPVLVQEGFHVQLGLTPPLHDCMLWREERRAVERVDLPEQGIDLPVRYLDDFVSFGWIEYATCGRRAANGWATDTEVFAVVPRYESLDSEHFRVNLLSHEAQHLADKRDFDGLLPWELEFRAKLAEVAAAETTEHHLLEKFRADRSDDPALPHSYANARVMEAIAASADTSAAAVAALSADTRRRRTTGGTAVRGGGS